VLFIEEEPPRLFLIPSMVWQKPVDPFVSRDYRTRIKGAEGVKYSFRVNTYVLPIPPDLT
jgi:hypothetical protein